MGLLLLAITHADDISRPSRPLLNSIQVRCTKVLHTDRKIHYLLRPRVLEPTEHSMAYIKIKKAVTDAFLNTDLPHYFFPSRVWSKIHTQQLNIETFCFTYETLQKSLGVQALLEVIYLP